MYFYSVLIDKKIPSIRLTYKSEVKLVKGTLVSILLRKNEVYGVIVSEQSPESIASPDKISEIKSILPYIFSERQMRLQSVISYNTFNSPNTVLDGFINPIVSLTKKDFISLKENQLNNNISLDQPATLISNKKKIEYYLDTEVVLRIIYIIRISIEAYSKSFLNSLDTDSQIQINILVLFPEKKYLDKVFKEFLDIGIESEFLGKSAQINIIKYSGDKTKSNRDSIYNILNIKNQSNSKAQINIIFSTRAGLFLPFQSLHDILVIDESNSMYIQEQNSLYFDARELSFILGEVFGANLNFISRVPSIRLYSFYPETVLRQYLTNSLDNAGKPLKIKVTGQNRKNDKYRLISDSVLRLVQKKDDSEGLASEVVDVNWVEDD